MARRGLSNDAIGRLHRAMADQVKRGDPHGLVFAVTHRGAAHVEALGTAAQVGGDPIRRDTIFRISSMSKPVTAAAAMVLVEAGNVTLDEPVDRLLPELAHRQVLRRIDGPLDETVPARRPIVVRDLLTFTLGFGLLFKDPNAVPIVKAANELQIGMGPPAPSMMPPPDEWTRRLGTLPLMYQPGEQWMYNTGADILSVLIARASGQPFETFLHERLFTRLGMRDTAFSVPPAKMGRFGPLYWTNYMNGKEATYDEAQGGQWSRPPAFPSGAGGLVSTIDDYLAFAQMVLEGGNHGKEPILSKSSVEAMTRNQLTEEQHPAEPLVPGYFDDHGWGFCMSVLTRGDALTSKPGRYGWDGGMGTSWFNDPNEDLTAVLMTNRMWSSATPPDICRTFWKLAYAAIRD